VNATISGKCGHTSSAENWLRDRYLRQLPPDTFRCPNCGYTFRREAVAGKVVLDHQGFETYTKGYIRVVDVVPVGAT
jgi:hypothetical protein